jgi:hypothetical protein
MAKKQNDLLSQAFRNLHKEISFLVADRDFYRELSEISLLELASEHWFEEDVDNNVQHFVSLATLAVKEYTNPKYLNRLEVDFDIGAEQEGLL